MKRFLLYTICGLLAPAGVTFAGPVAQYQTAEHDFGALLWHAPGTATFYVTNVGDADLYITSVRTDCGCTAAEWTREAIRPGETGTVSATFDAEMLGHFDKRVAVYTNAAEEPAWLTLSGRVVMEKENYEEDFPCRVGEIYLNTDELEFDDVRRGDCPEAELVVLNAGETPFRPELMHLPRYLTARAEPEVVRPGRVGRIVVTLDSERLPTMGLTRSQVYLSRFPGDRVGEDNEINVAATLLPESELAAGELDRAPVAVIDSTHIDLGAMGRKRRLKGSLTLSNDGRSPLVIKALQVYNPGISVKLGRSRIEPGESTKLRITLSADSHQMKGRRRVLLITNDPNNPKITIDVTAGQ